MPLSLPQLRDQLGAYVVEGMRIMVENSERAYRKKDATKGTWYPGRFIEVFERKYPVLIQTLRECGHLTHGWMSPDYFTPIVDASGKRRDWAFRARGDVLPSECLKAAMVGRNILDCGSVCHLARYYALMRVLGEDKFNRLFGKERGKPISTDFNEDNPEVQPMECFVEHTEGAIRASGGDETAGRIDQTRVNKRDVKVGQVLAFRGVKKYAARHFNGTGGHYNLVCLVAAPGFQRYVGHGTPAEGYTEEEIAELMVNSYNEEPSVYKRVYSLDEKQMAALEMAKFYATSLIHPKNPLLAVDGFDPTSPQEFKLGLIAAIVRAPLQKISFAFVKMQLRQHPGRAAILGVHSQGQEIKGDHRSRAWKKRYNVA